MVDAFSVAGNARRDRPQGPRPLRRSRATRLLRHQRPTRPRPSSHRPRRPPQLSRAAQREREAIQRLIRLSGDIGPSHVHDAPFRGLDRREPPPIALPSEPRAVMLEAIALASDAPARPRKVESESADWKLPFGCRQAGSSATDAPASPPAVTRVQPTPGLRREQPSDGSRTGTPAAAEII